MIDFAGFHPEVQGALREAGWFPGRQVDVEKWSALEDGGYVFHDMAREILAGIDDLTITPVRETGPNFVNDDPFVVDPAEGWGSRGIAEDIEDQFGGQYFPLGAWLSYSTVFVESSGRVVVAGFGPIWELGTTFEDALDLLVRSSQIGRAHV